jgi:hypothetical protein
MSKLWNYSRYRIEASSVATSRDKPLPSNNKLIMNLLPVGILPLDENSTINQRRVLEKMAKQFRREFHYDFIQFEHNEEMCNYHKPIEDHPIGILFYKEYMEDEYFIVGGGCFRWRKYKDADNPQWALQWIWIHPYERNQGRLSGAYPKLKELLGDFHVEGPLSHAMEGFLKSKNHKI